MPRIDPVAWEPLPPAPGALGVAPRAVRGVAVGAGVLRGPEDACVLGDGSLVTGCGDGWLYRVHRDDRVERFAHVGGRPLGVAAWGDGVVVCNHPLGLQRVDAGGGVTLLCDAADDGEPIRFANDVVVDPLGRAVFSDSSAKFNAATGAASPQGGLDMLEARPHGRLLRYDPATGVATTLARGLYFPNGVALTAAGDAALVVETFRYRVLRIDLTGAGAPPGVWADRLPGFADNLTRDPSTGRLWLAVGVRRVWLGDQLQRWPRAKAALAALPAAWWNRPRARGLVVELDDAGRAVRAFEDAGGAWGLIASATRRGEGLYLGTLDRGLVRLPV